MQNQVSFLSLCYDSTRDWTPVSQTTGENSTHEAKKAQKFYFGFIFMAYQTLQVI